MKRLDLFLIKNSLKRYSKYSTIGFYVEEKKTYNRAPASVRMRCYDLINYLEKIGVSAELYDSSRKYKLVIFEKTVSEDAVKEAQKLKEKKVPIIYDGMHDQLMNENKEFMQSWENTLSIIACSDCVITVSEVAMNKFKRYHNTVYWISENVNKQFFKRKKIHTKKDIVSLVYCGYSVKAKDILNISAVIERLLKEQKCELLLICEKDPNIVGLSYKYIKYSQKRIHEQLILGDIMIAPRQMEKIQNQINSISKIAYPMALGIPVVASPLKAYEKSPAVLCRTNNEWYMALMKLIEDVEYRKTIGEKSRRYVEENLTMKIIGREYMQIFSKYL